jgi:hypothetical protein
MTVRQVRSAAKRPASEPPEKPEPERPGAGKPESRPARPGDDRAGSIEARREPERQPMSGGRATADQKATVALEDRFEVTILMPEQSYAPIKYGSFSVPAVGVKYSFLRSTPPEEVRELEDGAIASLNELQEKLFEQELKTYIRRAKEAYEAATKEFGI